MASRIRDKKKVASILSASKIDPVYNKEFFFVTQYLLDRIAELEVRLNILEGRDPLEE